MGCAPASASRSRAPGAFHVVDTGRARFRGVVGPRFGEPRTTGGGAIEIVVDGLGGESRAESLECAVPGRRILVCGATAGRAGPDEACPL